MFVIVLFVVYLISVSAHTEKVVDAREGFSAPYFKIENSEMQLSIDEMKGKYLLLTFWSSSDAESRIMCNEYARFMRNEDTGKRLSHVAINFDRSERLFQEIVRRDKMNAETQFYVQGDKAQQLKKDYRLENGLRTYLVDKQGRVIAKNPTTKQLKQILYI